MTKARNNKAQNANASIARFEERKALLMRHPKVDSDDMQKVLGKGKSASAFEFTQVISDACDEYKIDPTQVFTVGRQKAIKRFVQFVHGVKAGDYKAIGSVRAGAMYAFLLAGDYPLNTDALQTIVSTSRNPNANLRGVSKATVNKLMGSVGRGTADSQLSNMLGVHGFAQLIGMTSAQGHKNKLVTLNKEHPLAIAFFATMSKATDAQIEEMTGEASE